MTGSIILGQKFKSLAELLLAIERYSKEQGVPYVKFNSTTAQTYNKDVDREKRMPLEQGFKDMVVVCKHYGKPRQSKHKPGTKMRSNQRTFKKYCIAKFNTCYNLYQKCHIVTKLEENHCNHVTDESYVKHYPEFRRAKKETVDKVNVLLENEAKTHRIRDVLLNSGVLATAQDIQNLRNKWLASCQGKKMSSEESLFNQLKKLKEDDPNSVVVIHYDEDSNVIQSIFFQTSYMRESLEQFPELLIMDTTYNLCNNEMPLVVFSVVDCFGSGRIAGYAIIFSENKQIVTAALEVLGLGCPKLAEEVRVVYIDKAQSEIASIKEVLPNAEIHLCDYHVKDAFSRSNVKNLVKDKDKEKGKDTWDVIDKHIKAMIHSHTREQYDSLYKVLNKVAGGEQSDFMKYFNRYWHNCGLVWCDYQRNGSLTLGERTTGRVESHNAKIKKMVDKKFPVSEVVLRLCVLNRNSSIENAQRVFNEMATSKYHKYSSDAVVQRILTINTPFVGKFLQAQYERSLEPPSETVHEVTLETCDCKYFNQTKLICSHIFRKRRLSGVEIYDHKLVPSRWTVIVPTAEAQNNFSKFQILTSPIKSSKIKKTMTQEERYNLAESIAKKICSHISNFGGDEYHQRINALKDLEDLLRMGKRVAVVGIDGEGQPDSQAQNLSDEPTMQKNAEGSNSLEVHSRETTLTDLGKQICVSGMKGPYSSLTSAVETKLKLPTKCPVPGRPKGKRGNKKKSQPQNKIDSHSDEDVDDVIPVSEDQCESCKGPVTCFTSCSKENRGRKYISCTNKALPACKDFHKWLSKDYEGSVNKQQDCIVCIRSGAPSINGGHKCIKCGDPVHALDGVPCCSISIDPEEEGFGTAGRKCLKCVDKEKALSSSISNALNNINLPSVSLDTVSHLIDKTVPVDFIDNAASTLNPSQTVSDCGSPPAASPNDFNSALDSFLSGNAASTLNPSQTVSDCGSSPPASPNDSPERIKICFGCKKPAVLLTARTPKNYGRQFYVCPDKNPERPLKCRWMNWKKRPVHSQLGSFNQGKITTFLRHETSQDFLPRVNSGSSMLDDGLDNILSNVMNGIDNDVKPIIPFNRPLSSDQGIITLSDDSDNDSDIESNAPTNQSSGYDVKPDVRFEKALLHPEGDCITISDDSDVDFMASTMFDEADNSDSTPCFKCVICSSEDSSLLTSCENCGGHVHIDNCSVSSPSSTNRLCHNCFCLLCKGVLGRDHVCQCFICLSPLATPGVICYRCERVCHAENCSSRTVAKEKDNAIRILCNQCAHTLSIGIPLAAWNDLKNNEMLTDHHAARASVLLRQQFGFEVDGLCSPLAVTYGKQIEKINHYPSKNSEKDFVQIMHTGGSNHWVTTVFKKGDKTVTILDSLMTSKEVSGHIKIQIGMIAQTAGVITVVRPPVPQQKNSVDCCLHAIAFATEFCFYRSIQIIEFDQSMLRQHWMKCLEAGQMSPFPRKSKRPKKMALTDDISFIQVHCPVCLLPDNYGDMVGCDDCNKWYHMICVGLTDTSEPWSCPECTSVA